MASSKASSKEAEELWDRSVKLLAHDGGPKEAEGLRLLYAAVDKGSRMLASRWHRRWSTACTASHRRRGP